MNNRERVEIIGELRQALSAERRKRGAIEQDADRQANRAEEAEKKAFDQHVMVGEAHTEIEELREKLERQKFITDEVGRGARNYKARAEIAETAHRLSVSRSVKQAVQICDLMVDRDDYKRRWEEAAREAISHEQAAEEADDARSDLGALRARVSDEIERLEHPVTARTYTICRNCSTVLDAGAGCSCSYPDHISVTDDRDVEPLVVAVRLHNVIQEDHTLSLHERLTLSADSRVRLREAVEPFPAGSGDSERK